MHGGLHSWSLPNALALIILAFVYSRGWNRFRRDLRNRLTIWRFAAFMSGVLSLSAVFASPLAHLDQQSLTAHMVQHLILMTVAAPLILLGEPAITLLHSLRRCFGSNAPGLLLPRAPVHGIERILAHPVFCWLAGTVCVILWHVPAAFNLGMRSEWWHEFEHATFLAAGLLFWWPVVQPWPTVARWPRWCIPLYLFFATLPCDALSAFLTFCDHVVYPTYVSTLLPFDTSALRDQEFAGALMWVWVTFVCLIPAVAITIRSLSPRPHSMEPKIVETMTIEGSRPIHSLTGARSSLVRSSASDSSPTMANLQESLTCRPDHFDFQL